MRLAKQASVPLHDTPHDGEVASTLPTRPSRAASIQAVTDAFDKESPAEDKGSNVTFSKSVFQQVFDKPSAEDEEVEQLNRSKPDHVPMTTRMEVYAWYLFDWGSSPYMGVFLSIVYPFLITSLGQEYGCTKQEEFGCDFDNKPITLDPDENRVLRVAVLGGWELKPASFAAMMLSFSSIIQAFGYISTAALADYGLYQPKMLRITAVVSALFPFVLVFATDSTYEFASIWAAFGVLFFGLSLIFYNAYLPQLVDNHWQVRRLERVHLGRTTDEATTVKKMEKEEFGETMKQVKQIIFDDISQWGYYCGYAGNLLMTIVAVVVMFALGETTTSFSEQIGSFSGSAVESHEEFWMKRVAKVDVVHGVVAVNQSYQYPRVFGLQLYYDEIDAYGDYFGSTPEELASLKNVSYYVSETYDIVNHSDGSYVTKVNVFVCNDANYPNFGDICALQFVNEQGEYSQVFGANTTQFESKLEVAEPADEGNFLFGGYTVAITEVSDASETETSESYFFISGVELGFVLESGQFGENIGLRVALVLTCVWWLVFALPAFFKLQSRRKPDLPEGTNAVTVSCVQFVETLKHYKQYPVTFKFLICYFLYSDAMTTIETVGLLFGLEELGMEVYELVIVQLLGSITGMIGTVFFLWLQKKIEWDARQMIVLHICLQMLIPLYACIGLIPNAQFGLVHKWEMYVFGAWFGFNFGIFAYTRSMFSNIIPLGMENQFFSLFEITDKGSSWIGPLVMAVVSNVASFRLALIYVLFFFLIPLPVIAFKIDYAQGIVDAGRAITSPKMLNDESNAADKSNTQDHESDE